MPGRGDDTMDAKTQSSENKMASKSGTNSAKGMPDAAVKYRPYPQVEHSRPHMADKTITKATGLVLGRPARRQPGARRPDGPRSQGAHVPAADRDGLQGNRDRLPLGFADRFRLRPLVRGGGQCARRRLPAGIGAVPAGTASPAPSKRWRAQTGRSCISTIPPASCSAASSSPRMCRASSRSPSMPPR